MTSTRASAPAPPTGSRPPSARPRRRHSLEQPNINDAGDPAVITVYPTTSPQDVETQDLVEHLRDDTVPATLAGEDAQAFIGGQTAAFDDVAQRSSSRCRSSCSS